MCNYLTVSSCQEAAKTMDGVCFARFDLPSTKPPPSLNMGSAVEQGIEAGHKAASSMEEANRRQEKYEIQKQNERMDFEKKQLEIELLRQQANKNNPANYRAPKSDSNSIDYRTDSEIDEENYSLYKMQVDWAHSTLNRASASKTDRETAARIISRYGEKVDEFIKTKKK